MNSSHCSAPYQSIIEQQRLESNASFYRSRLKLRGPNIPGDDDEGAHAAEGGEETTLSQLARSLNRADHGSAPNVAVMIESKSLDTSIEAKWLGRISSPRPSAAAYLSMEDRVRAVAAAAAETIERGSAGGEAGIDDGITDVQGEEQSEARAERSRLDNLLSGWGIKAPPPTPPVQLQPVSQPARQPASGRAFETVRSLMSQSKRLEDLLEEQGGEEEGGEGKVDERGEERGGEGEINEQGQEDKDGEEEDHALFANKPLGDLLKAVGVASKGKSGS